MPDSIGNATSSKEVPPPKKTILVIEDEVDLVETLKEVLESEGYRVITASNGEEGLQKLHQIHPNLILLDMNMPKMNGLQFYKNITEFDKNGKGQCRYPVLVLTARAELKELFGELEVEGFINKPFKLPELLDEIERIIQLPQKKIVKDSNSDTGKSNAKPLKILVVESDEVHFKTTISTFAEAGYLVTGAKSVREAFDRIHELRPDLVFVRYNLTEMTGDLLSLQLKKMPEFASIPVILYDEDATLKNDKLEQIEKEIGVSGLLRTCDPLQLVEQAKKTMGS